MFWDRTSCCLLDQPQATAVHSHCVTCRWLRRSSRRTAIAMSTSTGARTRSSEAATTVAMRIDQELSWVGDPITTDMKTPPHPAVAVDRVAFAGESRLDAAFEATAEYLPIVVMAWRPPPSIA